MKSLSTAASFESPKNEAHQELSDSETRPKTSDISVGRSMAQTMIIAPIPTDERRYSIPAATVRNASPTVPPTTEKSELLQAPEGVSAEDVILYFNEVCLDAEIVNGGDPSRLQKWDVPIRYAVFGSPTQEDTIVLTGFVDWLNTLEGFPGMAPAEESHEINLRIYFCSQEELLSIMGENFTGMDGAVTFWYEQDEIYDATICIRTDLNQTLRNSVILEELYNGLGPIQDTWLREDSIIYAGYSEPQHLTAVDELLLKLLYRPELQCGMDARECEILIRALYE